MAAQTVFSGSDVALAVSVLLFLQTLSGTILISVSQTVFQNQIVSQTRKIVPDVDPQVILNTGASDLQDVIRHKYPTHFDGILSAYNNALQRVFLICLICCCLSAFGVIGIEWISVKKDKKDTKNKPEAAASSGSKDIELKEQIQEA